MPRTYVQRNKRGKTPPDVMNEAVTRVIEEKRSVRSVAKEFGICHVTLRRYVDKKITNPDIQHMTVGYVVYHQRF